MLGSVVVNGVLGFAYCLVLLFSLGDLDSLLVSPTGFPFMQLFENTTKSVAGGTILSLVVSLVAVAANAAGLTSTSRTAWAFARDKAVPFDTYFAHVNKGLQIPVRMVALISILEALLGLLYLGSTTAFNAILSMAILGMYASYLLPIIFMLVRRWRKPTSIPRGVFRLGHFGGYVTNIVSVFWLVFAMIFSTFPSYQPVTSQNMNYSVVVMSGWLVFGVVYYYTGGNRRYVEPSKVAII
jgi:choline transport protein